MVKGSTIGYLRYSEITPAGLKAGRYKCARINVLVAAGL